MFPSNVQMVHLLVYIELRTPKKQPHCTDHVQACKKKKKIICIEENPWEYHLVIKSGTFFCLLSFLFDSISVLLTIRYKLTKFKAIYSFPGIPMIFAYNVLIYMYIVASLFLFRGWLDWYIMGRQLYCQAKN